MPDDLGGLDRKGGIVALAQESRAARARSIVRVQKASDVLHVDIAQFRRRPSRLRPAFQLRALYLRQSDPGRFSDAARASLHRDPHAADGGGSRGS
jgi:hypothetical protein